MRRSQLNRVDRRDPGCGSAVLSACGKYRYELWRCWDGFARPTLYVGALNPSTADATVDDHTIRKLFGFCFRLGFGSLCLWNLYALRATNPKDLLAADDPIGPDNDEHIARVLDTLSQDRPGRLVLAWGAHAKHDRVAEVIELIKPHRVPAYCWGYTASGQPRHPLMLRYATPLQFVNIWM